MTKTKKVVAVVLAFLMIFSSASVLASAWDVNTSDGNTLTISTKFFKEVDGEMVETQKVAPGSTVKARVYLGTDYYSNNSDLLFFYDKDFFTHSYGDGIASLEINPAITNMSGYLHTTAKINDQVSEGYITSDFLNDYAYFAVALSVNTTTNVMFDSSTWLFEFTLTVLDDATGEGDLFVEESTIQNKSRSDAYISVPKGPADASSVELWPMRLWNAQINLSSAPVSTLSSVTFNANNGEFEDGTDTAVVGTDIGDAVTAPEVTRDGYTFIGWIDAEDDTPTLEEAKATVVIDKVPEEPVAYNAYWLKNVNITFDTDDGTQIPAIENVTPYTDFADVADPKREGYTFVGWDVRGGELPATYPDVDTKYTAVWALNVTVSFDTDGGTEIPSVDGYEGDAFTATIPNPTKAGHRFVMWQPSLPTVFPKADTTYTAIYEAKIYNVQYYVDGKLASTIQLEYGSEIPTNITNIKVPAGKELTGKWYTDSACETEFAAGTLMGEKTVKLYTETVNKEYNAVFVVDDVVYESIQTAYEANIVVPANEPTKVGYIFTGWSPDTSGIFSEANDMYFYATWAEAKRNVEYYSDGALYETFDVETGAEIDIPAEAYKEGYTFKGWADTADATEANVTFPQTMPVLADGEVVKFYAVFEINEYTVTWDVDGDTTEETYEFGATINKPDDPTKTGYTFAGWSPEVPATMGAADVTYTAQWDINQYTITYADTYETEIAAQTDDYGTAVNAVATPVRTGYSFEGWAWTKTGTDETVEAPATIPAYNVTATAQWKINQYKAVFNSGDGAYDDNTTSKDVMVNFGETPAAPATPSKIGYIFKGWTPDLAPIGVDGATYTAVFEADTVDYTVETYIMDTEGNYGVAASSETKSGTADTNATVAHETKEGFSADLGKSILSGNIAPDESLVLKIYYSRNQYALYTKYDAAAEEVKVADYYYEEVIAKPADPADKEGHTFAGWEGYTDGMTMPAGNATFTATWTVNKYEVIWNVDGVETKETYAYGATINKPDPEPTKTGYTFAGWSPEVPATQGAGDATYTATWNVNSYDLTWEIDGVVYEGPTSTPYGTAITAPVPERDGYTFSGWTGIPTDGKMPANNLTVTGSWIADSDTTYTVETYLMGTDGTYGEPSKEVKAGTTDTPATVAHETKEGFSADLDKSVLSGNIAADNSLVLKLYYSRNQYALYTKNDVGAEAVKVGDVYYGAEISEPAEPGKTGYTFAGWEGYTAGMTMPAEDVTLTAKWDANTNTAYKVVINYKDAANGDTAATVEFPYQGTTGNAIEIVDAAGSDADTEYVLWKNITLAFYELDESAANETTGTVAADGSTVLNVYFVPVMYTATFDAVEGAWAADGEKTKTAEVNHFTYVKDVTPATEPVREGYSFGGWAGVTDTLVLNSDRTFRANWTINQYTVTYADTYETEIAAQTDDYGTAVNAVETPVRTGYSFEGWAWTNTKTGEAVNAPATIPAYDVTATAQWAVNQYTVTYADTYETTIAAQTDDYGTAVNAVETPVRTGYTFNGWVWTNTKTGEAVNAPATIPAYDVTATAQWTVNQYTVTYADTYETTIDAQTDDYGTAVNAVATPVRTGYTFNGWAWTNTKTGEAVNAPATIPAYDVTATAQWTVNQYTVTYADTYETEIAAQTDNYGTAVNAVATPVRTGYTFNGWVWTNTDTGEAVEAPATIPAYDVTATAQWKINQYKAVFNSGDGAYKDGTTSKEVMVNFGETPKAPETPSKEGYGFSGWTPDLAPIGVNGATYTAVYTAGAVEYKIETYIMDTEGNYGAAASSETKSGTADTEATTAHGTKTGFSADLGKSVLSGNIAADGSLVLKLYYSRNQYALYTKNDADAEAVKVADYYYEAAVAEPTAPANKEGHTFAGWDGYTAGMTMPAADTTLTAKWTVNQYTVTYADTYETTIAAQTDDYGTAVNAVATPVRTGYTFNGWAWTKTEGGEAVEAPATIPAYNVTATAQWTINQYTVTYADTYETEIAAQTDDYGTAVNAVATPVRTGYTFNGWAWTNTKTGEAVNAPATIPAYDVTATAQWTVNQYTVTYADTYETTIDAQTDDYGTAVNAVATPVRTGYGFAGWVWTNTKTGEVIEAPVTIPAYDVTATAQWTANEYTITYRTYNGVYDTKTVAYGSDLVYPDAEPTREGHTFNGWLDNKGAALPATMPAGNLVAVAQWTVDEYTVTWVVDDESTEETYAYGATINKPDPEPSKTGYTFAGWSPEVPATQGVGDATYTATWNVNSYDLTWVIDGATYEGPTSTPYGTELVAPVPTRDGYTFSGWTGIPADGKMPASNLTVTGSWIADSDTTYTVETYLMGTDGTYGEPSKEIKSGTTDTLATVAHESKEGFSADLGKSVLSGNIAADNFLVLKLYYSRNQYALYTKNDADAEAVKVADYYYEAAVAKPEEPTKTGYTFAGWEGYTTGMTMPAADTTLTAQWTVNQYTVTYADTYETAIAAQTDDYGTAVNAVATPVRTGYTFNGWAWTNTKTGEAVNAPATIPAYDVTATAQWTINQYTVTYADTYETVIPAQTDDYGTAVNAVATPVRTGYTFNGWAWTNTKTGEAVNAPATIPAYDVTATAQWTVNQYTVTYADTYETTIDAQTDDYGTAVNAVATPVRTGYTFNGWAWTNTKTGEAVNAPATIPAYDVTATAQWTVNQYTVTYADTYETEIAAQTDNYGTAVNAVATPVRTGYTFNGWVWTNTDTGEAVEAPATIPAYDVTATAQWTINQYTVTYAKTGDSTIAAQTDDYGTAINAVEDPTWSGYTFRGWVWTDAQGNTINKPATIPAYNVTATAQWTANNYSITWTGEGVTTAINNYDFGDTINVPADPVREGYNFAGWTWTKETADGEAVASSATMPAYNVVATAQWTAKGDTAYTVEIYKMATDGKTYELVETIDTLTGATDAKAKYVVAAETGFTVNAGMTTGYDADANTASATIAADGSTVIKVYYDRDTYKITVNGETDEYYYGEEIPVPVIPEDKIPEGHKQDTENPWIDENGDPIKLPLIVDDSNPTEIKPNWSVLSFDVTWTIDGVTTTETYEYGATINVPEIPAKEGFRFDCWIDADGNVVKVPATMPASDLAFTAVFEARTYGVYYYVDGALVETLSGEYGDTIATEGVYTAPTGYSFNNVWYTDADCTAALADGATITTATTRLYGKTTANMYEAIFMVDGEVYKKVETAYDSQIVAPEDPSKDGYVFVGWDPDVALMDDEGKIFNAVWAEKADAYKVTYMMGTEADAATYETFTHAIGEEVDRPADPYKEGYTFAGWVDAEGNAATIADVMPAEDLTYYASWTVIEYTVIWYIEGTPTKQTYAYGAEITAPKAEKENFEFVGWAETENGATVKVPENMPAENLVYYAVFSQNTFTVTYYDYEESEKGPAGDPAPERTKVHATQTYDAGAELALPEAPSIEHYIFTGWVDAEGNAVVEGAEVTANTSYYATYDRVAVKLLPKEGTSIVIERNGVKESYNDNSVTSEYNYTTANYNKYYVYGFTLGRNFPTIANVEGKSIVVQGDGRLVITPREGQTRLGTGTQIDVYDNVTGELVETVYVVVFGDLNGDGMIMPIDVSLIDKELSGTRTWSNQRGSSAVWYMIKAANLDGQGQVLPNDATLLSKVSGGLATVSQVTGIVTLK